MAALAAAAGTILESCGGGGGGPTGPSSIANLPIVSGSATSAGIAVTIDANSPLAAVGSAALVDSPAGAFLVAHTGQDAFSVLTGTCTHQRCTITGFANGSYVCPCHGSNFSTSGAVLTGPAVVGLRAFANSFANGVLTITG